jgi:putative component of membrane protein insertase Oxa1/YidC/SpoIIIJ protein YidD
VILRRIALAFIRFYQRYLSPLKRPSIVHCGVLRGGLKALWRLLRCQPCCAGGYDPVLPPPPACGQLEGPEEAKP